jgi:hypothetical protein
MKSKTERQDGETRPPCELALLLCRGAPEIHLPLLRAKLTPLERKQEEKK